MARISILSIDEINSLYALPNLENDEQDWAFELEPDDCDFIASLSSIGDKINYILQLGYYRVSSNFFLFGFKNVKEDVLYLLKKYFPSEPFPKKQSSKHRHYHNRYQLYQKFGLKEADDSTFKRLLAEGKRIATIHALPKFILTSLLSFCHQQHIVRPAYYKLQDVVSEALKAEQNRLNNILYVDTDKVLRAQLDRLLENDELLYNLTLLKKDQKDFSTTEIRRTVQKQQLIIDVFLRSKDLVKRLGISEQNIIYYASLAEFYTIQKLRSFKTRNKARLYLLCYVQLRLRKINDHLINSFVYRISKYIKMANDFQRTKVDVAETDDKKLRKKAYQVLMIDIDEEIPDDMVREKAFEIVPKTEFQQFLADFEKPNFERDFYRWEYYGKSGRKLKRNIRPIFCSINFTCDNHELTKAVEFLRQHIDNNRSFKQYDIGTIPLGFFPKASQRFLLIKLTKKDKKKTGLIDGDRYEFMVYLQLQKSICDISSHIKDSNSFRALEDELIDIEHWETNKQSILDKLNMPTLSTNIVSILNDFEVNIEENFRYVNQRINDGSNSCIKLKYNKQQQFTHWTLPYEALEAATNNHFFNSLTTRNIADLAQFVEKVTGYGSAFTHIQPKYAKLAPELEVINACIIANATGTEIQKMIDISDIDGKDLKRTNDNFIRVQTLRLASDTIVNKTAKLPIFKEYNLSEYGVHASVDGQKLAARYGTIKARHSKKYFGLRKGIVPVTLSDNHLPINLNVIGANEHESCYLLDLVESNTSDIDVTAVSGDMHSINRVNFALMYMFGYRFMPRFTNLTDKSDTKLVGFRNLDDYSHHIIKASKKANKALIISEWDKVLRVLASIALKKTTQASIIRKLSTTSTMSPTLKAMIAFNEIVMTDYLLLYIDDKETRTIVQRSLNRGESYHQLSSKIAKVNGGRMLNGRTEIEININAECIRLLANIIIHHNAILLSELFKHYETKDPEKCKEIIRWSPVAWRFINLIGNYEFYKDVKPINIEEVIKHLIDEFENELSSKS